MSHCVSLTLPDKLMVNMSNNMSKSVCYLSGEIEGSQACGNQELLEQASVNRISFDLVNHLRFLSVHKVGLDPRLSRRLSNFAFLADCPLSLPQFLKGPEGRLSGRLELPVNHCSYLLNCCE